MNNNVLISKVSLLLLLVPRWSLSREVESRGAVCVSTAVCRRGGSDSEQTVVASKEAVGYRLADDLNSTVVIGSN